MRAAVAAGGGVVTARQLAEVGIEDRQVQRWVRTGVLVRLRRGVYTTAELWDGWDGYRDRPLAHVRAAHATVQFEHAFSHDSAGIVQRVRLLRPRESTVHLTRDDMRGRRNRHGIEHHGARVDPARILTVEGLPVLDVPRTVVDLAREHGYVAGLVAADGALADGWSRRDLDRALSEMSGWPYSRTARAVVEDADGGAESVGETLSRDLVAGALGVRPETQFPVLTRGGVRWADLRVGRHLIEFDGRIKYGGEVDDRELEQILWDERRRATPLTDERFGLTRLIYADHFGSARVHAEQRIVCDHADAVARYGTELTATEAELAARLRRGRLDGAAHLANVPATKLRSPCSGTGAVVRGTLRHPTSPHPPSSERTRWGPRARMRVGRRGPRSASTSRW